MFSIEEQASVMWEIISGGEVLSNKDALAIINEEIGLGELGDVRDALNSEESNVILRKNGYDGIISSLGNGINEYIVFDLNQIKQIPYRSRVLDLSSLLDVQSEMNERRQR